MWSLHACRLWLLLTQLCLPDASTQLRLLQLVTLKNKWMIYRGAHADDSLVVASVNRELFTLHHGVQAKLPGSDAVEYSLRAKGFIVGNREVDILHRGQSIGHVSPLQQFIRVHICMQDMHCLQRI